jgi:hypothetical protein
MKNIVLEYSDIFEGEGNFQGALKLEIDESIPPVKSTLRRIPIALEPKLKNELQRLEKLGVIKPVKKCFDCCCFHGIPFTVYDNIVRNCPYSW